MVEGTRQEIRSFTVQIRKNDRKTIEGTAFVVNREKGLLVTCRHVIEFALDSKGLFKDSAKAQDSRVWVYFPHLPEGLDKLRQARVFRFFPDSDDDVVLLQLEKLPLPQEVEIAILGKADESIDHRFKSYGFRHLENYCGLPAEGKIVDFCDIPANHAFCHDHVFLSSPNVDRGMSGAAVLDCKRNLVVGVIYETWDSAGQQKDRDTCWAIDCAVFQKDPFNLLVRDKPCPIKPNPELKAATVDEIPKLSPVLNNSPAYIDENEWVGRNALLQDMNNSWAKAGGHIIGLIGFGGEGKSSLARHWLDDILKNQSNSPDGAFWWSFNENPNVDEFFDAALCYVTRGCIDPRRVPSTESKVETIGGAFGGRYLFILDGLETMQKQSGDQYGDFISDNLRNFVINFTTRGNNSFCLITSRLPVIDLLSHNSYTEYDVGRLTAVEGRDLLRKLGVKGTDYALDQVVADWDGHALTLTLLAAFLIEHYEGAVAHINVIPLPTADEPRYQRVTCILQHYDRYMDDAERDFLMICSVFRRPMEQAAVDQIFRNKKDADSLTAAITLLDDLEFEAKVKQLVNCRILRADQSTGNYSIHPLIRSHYYERLNHSGLTKLAHKIIKKYYLQSYRDTQDPTIDDLAPLIEAVYHSCRAGEYEDGYKIYLDKIDKKQGALLYQMGAYETDLALMLEFFPQGDLSKEPLINDICDKAYLIRSLGLCLMTVGRLQQALSMYTRSRMISLEAEAFLDAGKSCQLLSELHIHRGELAISIDCADKAMEYYLKAKESCGERCSPGHEMWGVQNAAMGTPQLTVCCLSYQAWALHLSGDKQEASAIFKRAEKLAHENNPKMYYLPDLWGIYHADHLLLMGDTEYARKITEDNLKYAQDNQVTEIISQCHRVMGDIYARSGLQSAKEHYNEALKIARNITHRAVLIEALLGRGRWNTLQGNIDDALANLEEALGYATTGGYRIYEADIHMALAKARGKIDPPAGLPTVLRAYQLSGDMNYYWVKEEADNFLKNFNR